MDLWELTLVFLAGSGVLALAVKELAAWLKGLGFVKNLRLEQALDEAAAFGVYAIENYARKYGLKGEEKFDGAVEFARGRLEQLGAARDEEDVRRSVAAAYEELKGNLHDSGK